MEELKKLIEKVESSKIDLQTKQDELSKAELAFTTALEEVIEKCNELMDF